MIRFSRDNDQFDWREWVVCVAEKMNLSGGRWFVFNL